VLPLFQENKTKISGFFFLLFKSHHHLFKKKTSEVDEVTAYKGGQNATVLCK